MVDEGLEAAKERAWREVAAIDAAHREGVLDDEGWHTAMAAIVVPAYLAAETAEGGSGHSGSRDEWEYSRGIVAEAIPASAATFLDVGCANGLLMESVHRWTSVEPHGLEIAPELAELARRRYPQWASRIHLGNAIRWEPPQHFDVVRTSLEYVPPPRRKELLERLLAHVVAPRGRLVIGKFNEETDRRPVESLVRSWGFHISGSAERPHPSEPRLVYRLIWIDSS